jgi:hypothetical protein
LIPILNAINTDLFLFFLLCNISQIATGVPYSEYPRNRSQSGPILINIRCNLTCFGPVQSVDLLGWGSMSSGSSHTLLKKVGVHVLTVLSKITQTGGGTVLVLEVAFLSHSHLARISLPSHVVQDFVHQPFLIRPNTRQNLRNHAPLISNSSDEDSRYFAMNDVV